MLKAIGIIPARLNSTRLPRKMLADIAGRPLVYWTWRQASKAKLLDEVVVATESKEIFDAVVKFGGKAIMAAHTHNSGSDRVAAAARKFPWAEVVINIQGDEPLISPSAIDAIAEFLIKNKKAPIATVASNFEDQEELNDPGNGKVVLDKDQYALYFSRSVVPYHRNAHSQYLKHIGIYGFQRGFLAKYSKMEPTPLEKAEGLEQLRILEHGYPIKVIVGAFTSVSVDTPADLEKVRAIFKRTK